MANSFARLRKLFGTTEVAEEFRRFANTEGKVYIIRNDSEYFDFDVFLHLHACHLQSKIVHKQEDRTPSDATRVAAVMLAPENRAAVAGILSGVRDRTKSDQSVDPTKAWAILAVEQFKDSEFKVPKPDGMDPEDVEDVDPNDIQRISLPRDSQWFMDTWKHYLKKKYKVAIKRWDTETGCGSHESHEFSKFCDSNKWLVWVYLLDLSSGFLLLANAHGKPPSYVGMECGFEDSAGIISDLTSNLEDECDENGGVALAPSVRGAGKRSVATTSKEAVASFKKRNKAVIDFVTDLQKDLDTRQKLRAQQVPQVGGTNAGLFGAIIAANKMKEELEKATLCMPSPARRMVLKGITDEICKLGNDFMKAATGNGIARSETSLGDFEASS